MPILNPFTDGDFSSLLEVEGRNVLYPFRNEQAKDLTTKIYERVYEIDRSSYTPAAALSQDPDDSTAYLITESDPSPIGGDLVRVVRRYAKIPIDQVSYEMRSFNRPGMDGIKAGSYWSVSWDDLETTWLFAVRKTIATIAALASDIKSVTGTISGSGTISGTGTVAGTGTLAGTGTVAGQKQTFANDALPSTTLTITNTAGTASGLNCNSGVSSFQTVLTTLSITAAVVRTNNSLSITVLAGSTSQIKSLECNDDSVVISGSGGSYTITRTKTTSYADKTDTRSTTDTRSITDTRATLDTRSLTDTHNVTESYIPSASIRVFTTSGAHGAAVGDRVAFFQGDRIVAKSIVMTVPNSTTFSVLLADVPGADFGAATVVFSSGAAFRYVNGERDCTIKITRKYYLPGISPGISSGADIPQTTLYQDPIGWQTAISAGLSYAAIASKTGTWEGCFLVKQIEEVQMADALESRGISA